MTGELFSASWANYLLQGTICIAAGLIGSFLLRRRSSRAHQVLLLAMSAALAVPVMRMVVKHYELGMFVSRPTVTKLQDPAPLLSNYYIMPALIPVEKEPYIPAVETEYSPSAAPAATVPTRAELPLASILMWFWIVVSAVMASRLFITFLLGIRLLHNALAVSCHKLRQALCVAKDKLGIDKTVVLYASRRVSSPVIWCWSRRPALLVPEDADQFDESADWVGMFCHELAHYRRLDHISGLFAELMVCIFSWHPLVWWARMRLAGLSEQACDDWVVASGRSAADYAESLLDLSPQGQLALLPAVVGRKKGLQKRVRRIVKDKCGNPRVGVRWALAVSVAAACITIGAAFAQTRPAKTEQVEKAEIDEVEKVEDEVWQAAKQQLITEQQELEQQWEATVEKDIELRKVYQDKLQTLNQQLSELRWLANLMKSELKNVQYKEGKTEKDPVEGKYKRLRTNKDAEDMQVELEHLKAELRVLGEQMKNIECQLNAVDDTRRRGLSSLRDPILDAQHDDLMRYRRDLQKPVDKVQYEHEARKYDTAEKAKTHELISAPIKEIEKPIQYLHSPIRPITVDKDPLLQDKEHENLMLFKRELQAVRDRTRSRLDGLPKESDKLRDELKKIEAMILSIDAKLHGLARRQENLIDDFQVEKELRHQEMTAERQALQLNAKEIERKLKQAPDRKDAEKLLMELDQIKLRIREIDSQQPDKVLRQVQSELRDEYEMRRQRLLPLRRQLEDRAKQIELKFEQAPDTENADKLLMELDQIEEKIREIDFELSSPEWCAVKRKTLRSEKPKDHRPAEKLKSDSTCSSCHADVDHIEVHGKLRAPVIPDQEVRQTLPRLQKYPDYSPWVTNVPKKQPRQPTEPTSPAPAQAEKLQRRVNQLQDEMSRLRSEIAQMRKLLATLVTHEKKRTGPSPNDIDILGAPGEIEKKGQQPVTD